MDKMYIKHYIKIDGQNRVVDGWSDGPHGDRDTTNAICINEEAHYHFRMFIDGEENPPLYTMDDIPLYKWDGESVQKRTEDEIAADQAAIPDPPPTTQEDLMEMAIDHELRLTMLELGV